MKFSRSLVVDLEGLPCPAFIKGKWVDKSFKEDTTVPMKYGNYFEYLALGSMAYDEPLPDLPTLKNGKPPVDQERIEQQAQVFKNLFDPEHEDFCGWHIQEKQIPVEFNDETGIIDFIAKKDDEVAICDLKLTKDLAGGYWGDLRKVDWIQVEHYHHLAKNIYGDHKMLWWIFDYSRAMNILALDLEVKSTTMRDQRFADAYDIFSEYHVNDFPKEPSFYSCKRCKLDCDVRMYEGKVNYRRWRVG